MGQHRESAAGEFAWPVNARRSGQPRSGSRRVADRGSCHQPVRAAELVAAVAVQGQDAGKFGSTSGRPSKPARGAGSETQLPAERGGGDAVVRCSPVHRTSGNAGSTRDPQCVGQVLGGRAVAVA